MIETNIRVVKPGPALALSVRVASLISPDPMPDVSEKACGVLRRRYGLAAVRAPGGSSLLVLTPKPIEAVTVQGDDWFVEVRDSGAHRQLQLTNRADAQLMSQLLERLLVARTARTTALWSLDSPRIWYEPDAFENTEGVAAYRRFDLSAIAIETVGIGLVVDVRTAFFTLDSLADFFDPTLRRDDASQRQRRFNTVSQRQRGQKGTLLYDLGTSRMKCYFEGIRGTTASTSGRIRVRGEDYQSLLDYYRRKHPTLPVGPDDLVALVSFPGIDRPVQVAARLLRVRVGNEGLPKSLKNVDKIDPSARVKYIESFWASLGRPPLGPDNPDVDHEFWRPSSRELAKVQPTRLAFGGGCFLEAPVHESAYKDNYRQRKKLLDRAGCFSVPATMPRHLHFALPRDVGDTLADRLADDITRRISSWTKKEISFEICLYDRLQDALVELQRAQPGVAVVVFENGDPATYFNIAHELKAWRVKRIMAGTLRRRYNTARWESLVELSALEILQHLDCVPWAPANALRYDAHLAIDVGADRRYFALSLVLCTPSGDEDGGFRIRTVVEVKPDPKCETINEIILRDRIVALFKGVPRHLLVGVKSILALRDGRESGGERIGVTRAIDALVEDGTFPHRVHIDVIDFHKSSLKGLRAWERLDASTARNVFEGTAILLGHGMAMLFNTGAATLTQGTAEPVVLVSRDTATDFWPAISDAGALTHENWSSPSVAQRLPIHLKRTDDELQARAAQEIRRIT